MNEVRRKPIYLIYDMECPACQFYCQLARIRESVGELVLVDARKDFAKLQEVTRAGLDIDEGMVLMVDDTLYYGADAIHALALLSSRHDFFNRLTYWVFRSKRFSSWLYPVLRFFRNLLLKMLGRTRINNLRIPGNDRF